MILVETLSNPTLRIADLEGIVALGRHCGIPVAVDNTFATPRALNPLALGADMVIHSVTKLLAGHSDATLGYVAAASSELNHRLSALSATLGTTPAPFDCWLAERGLYTFGLRYDRASATAARLAEALADAGLRVFYPTRDDHPDRDRATTLLGGQGGHMVSFDLGGGREEANRFARTLDEVAFAPTLGDIATTLSHPASSSHRGLTPEARHALGISEGFFRISVGCEDPDDLTRAFLAALA